ncbi:MAG: right-handed parallel beta-helix repeat-containing protein [Gemmatimonadetes bacterium]|nr:right-handed parallel beta-helix repeat-containing protein [Gemmatimonadota bacterium]
MNFIWDAVFLSLALAAPALATAAGAQVPLRTVPLTAGMTITSSVRIRPGTYRLPADASLDSALVTVRGEGITVDMRGVRLEGTALDALPDEGQGVAVRVDGGRDVRIMGATIRGYRIALLARGTRGLTLSENDLSHNWKPRLFSLVGHESLVDWLSYHQNEKREWMRFGAAIYLEDVTGGEIRGNRAEQGMNALLMTRTDSVTVLDNVFAFNSGLGIGMYRSSWNVIARNRVDYDVRGYSHGWYRRGQDSAGLLMFEQSSHNIVAWNSVTHGGDGLFLWAGQSTMDTGAGGANDNLYFANDFSFAPTNGIEATFSRNRFVANVVEGNDHGVWGGYSYESEITGNCFARNRVAIAIEHGQDNAIARNAFAGDTTAIYLWANPIEPSDWVYPRKRDTRSRDYRITGNTFRDHLTTWRVSETAPLDTSGNAVDSLKALDARIAPGSRERRATRCDPRTLLGVEYDRFAEKVGSYLPGGAHAIPAAPWPRRERSAIVVDEWGPFDWRSPKLWPMDTLRDAVRLRTLGPAGRWRVVAMDGVRGLSARSGTIGDTLIVRPHADREHDWAVTLEYVGAATVSPNGVRAEAGAPVRFAFERREPRLEWDVRYFTWSDTLMDPDRAPGNLDAIVAGTPTMTRREARLDYQWYRARFGLPQERWALDARATVDVPAGVHSLRVISDDAARVWVDGQLAMQRAQPGGSEVMYAAITPGRHAVRVAFYQLTGWTELRVEVVRGGSRSVGSAGPH